MKILMIIGCIFLGFNILRMVIGAIVLIKENKHPHLLGGKPITWKSKLWNTGEVILLTITFTVLTITYFTQ